MTIKGISYNDIYSRFSKGKTVIFILDVEGELIKNDELRSKILGLSNYEFFSSQELTDSHIYYLEFDDREKGLKYFRKNFAYKTDYKEKYIVIEIWNNGEFEEDNN